MAMKKKVVIWPGVNLERGVRLAQGFAKDFPPKVKRGDGVDDCVIYRNVPAIPKTVYVYATKTSIVVRPAGGE